MFTNAQYLSCSDWSVFATAWEYFYNLNNCSSQVTFRVGRISNDDSLIYCLAHGFASRLSKWKKWAVLRLTQVGVELSLVLADDDDEHVVCSNRRVDEGASVEVNLDGVAKRLVAFCDEVGSRQVLDFDGSKV